MHVARRCVRPVMWLVVLLAAAVWGRGVAMAQTFDVSAPAAFLMEATTGQILFEKNADEARRPASLVKLMTLLVAMNAVKAGEISLADEVRTSSRAAGMAGSQVYLSVGELLSLESLLRAVAIAGANDASIAVAEYVSGTEEAFVNRMNETARALGLRNTIFQNSHGLPPASGDASWTSARDIAVIARELVLRHPEVLTWTSVRVEPFREDPPFNLYNTNELVGRYEGLDGLRTGYTSDAGYLLVATAKRGDVRLISVVMAAASDAARQNDTRALLDFGFNRFTPTLVGSEVVGEIDVPTGTPRTLEVRVDAPVRALVPRGVRAEVAGEIVPSAGLEAPIAAGDEVGAFVVKVDGAEAFRVPVFATVDVARAGVFERIWRGIKGLFGGR